MKDELKIFTEEHRDDFEQYTLDIDQAWEGIEDKLKDLEHQRSLFPWAKVLKIAAVFTVVLMVGFGYYLNNQRIALDKSGIALHNISSELADTEAFYSAQIEEKLQMIKVSTGSVDPEVQTQLGFLDEEYESLKKDLQDNADSEEVINAMIEYYRLKLSMLEKILDEVQKNDENKDYEEVQAI